MRRRRYPRRVDEGLFPELREVLLDGWATPWQPPADDPNEHRIFEFHDADLRAAWGTHRCVLLAEWRRRGRTGPPWAAQQFDSDTTQVIEDTREITTTVGDDEDGETDGTLG